MDLDTSKQPLEINSHNVLMLTCDGYYRQVDGCGETPSTLAGQWVVVQI